MEVDIRLSRERMFLLTKHQKELANELQGIYPEENKALLAKYKELENTINNILDSEVKYQYGFLQ